ncbi:MAG TPA: hypothetical protein PKN96_05400 [Flavobacterium sp.]|uniref:hypothetical protein n=1 Tax=Flavobacterium sp. TaxID=239 RepID=UPI002C9FFA1C|nr:hypothetical protein [Flavobacterium sp.]HNP32708.1 hypothetical protein [Flavobacterium sp.]
MVTQTQSDTGKFSTYLALTSFGIGTLFLVAHLQFPEVEQILIFGLLYVILAILLNGIALINLIYQLIIKPRERETLVIRIMILLSNIPIALLYLNIVFHNNLF